MEKLKLNLEDLKVESFEANSKEESLMGTVYGQITVTTQTGQLGCPSNPQICVTNTNCYTFVPCCPNQGSALCGG